MSDPFKDIDTVAGAVPPEIEYWQKEIDLSLKREKKWRKAAKDITNLYEAGKEQDNSFNILYSNTDTLLPAIYNALPRPIVERRYKDNDGLGKFSSRALERVLSYLMDSADGAYDPFHSLMEQAVLGALVPGRGLTRFRYDPEFEDMPSALGDEEDSAEGESKEAPDASENNPVTEKILETPGKRVKYEAVCGEDIDYDQFLMGYARRWVDVPWIAFSHDMTKEDLEVNFGNELAELVPLNDPMKTGEWKKDERSADEQENRGSAKTALVYEIWAKGKKEILFYSPAYKKGFLKRVPDPLKLSGFYPCPAPLQFVAKRSTIVPTPLYKMYEPQAKELNRVSMRINRIVNALKVRGFYDGSIQGLKDLLNADDNTLIGAKNVAQLQDGKNLTNSIWMMPLGELITVLQQLLMAREACKATIYEITGISDIMRGNTKASETLGAQELKTQWGGQRVSRMQMRTQEYVRGCLRIMGEISGEHFGEETFAGMTGLPYATKEEVARAQKMQVAVQQAMLQLPPPMPGAPGAPPTPPQVPPQVQQMMQQVQAVMQKPKWDDVLKLLRDDVQRSYRIDIETNSTVSTNTAEDKQNIVDAMTAIANTMQTFGPFVEQGVFPMPAFKQMLLSITRRYEFGRQVEDEISAIPDQVPQTVNNTPEKGPPQEVQQAEVMKAQTEMQALQLKQQSAKIEAQHHDATLQKEMQDMARENEMAQSKHQLALAQNAAKLETVAMEKAAKIAKAEADIIAANAAKAKAQADITLAGQSVEKAAIDLEVGRTNAAMGKEKAALDGEVHKATAKSAIEKASAKEPPPAPKGPDETAAAVRELLAHIAKPATATRDKASGKITIQR